LDPDKDPITPLHIEMLAGEELPHLLQTLLVGVEHAICRIPLDELTFPLQVSCEHNSIGTNYLFDDKSINGKKIECNLKRRELITKNNSINKKYAAVTNVKRITCNGSSINNIIQCDNESEVTAFDAECSNKDSVDSTNDILNVNNDQTATASTLPLFCLGGSFPHIDSDEESGDDAKKIQSGKWKLKLKFFRVSVLAIMSQNIKRLKMKIE
jgi:hypothetical protein